MRTGRLDIEGLLVNERLNIIENNIMTLAFYRAIDNSESIFNLDNGFMDEFEDESGIDTTASLNEEYDSVNDLYSPVGSGQDENTELLLNFNEADGSLEVYDSSGQDHIITPTGGEFDNTNKQFGATSRKFNGSSEYFTIPDSSDWDIIGSSADRTIDFFIKFDVHSGFEHLIVQREDDNNFWSILHGNTLGFRFQAKSGGSPIIETSYAGEITDTNWHHIALIKVGNIYAIYVDGTQVNYLEDSSNDTFNASLIIGAYGGISNYFDGNMDEIRIQHSNIFNASPVVGLTDTITVPTTAHTADSNTKLLLHCDTFDLSDSAHPVYFNGTAQIDTAEKKFGSGSLLLDGDSDYLSLLDSASWDIVGNNTDTTTIDFWVKHGDHAGTENYFMQREDANNYWQIFHNDGDGIRLYVVSGGSSIIDTGYGGEITDTNWHHIALIIKGTGSTKDIGIYKNGTQVVYLQDSDIDTFTGSLYIGSTPTPSSLFEGHLDGIRFQASNIFNASPNVGLTDTITVPTSEYSGTPQNMTLQSLARTAESGTEYARIVIFEEDIDSITLNTDLTAKISLDDGVTWADATLEDDGNYEGSKRILASDLIDMTASGIGSGTDILYKLETANNKDLKIHGVGVNWL